MKATREVQFSLEDRGFSQVYCTAIFSHIARTVANIWLPFMNASDEFIRYINYSIFPVRG